MAAAAALSSLVALLQSSSSNVVYERDGGGAMTPAWQAEYTQRVTEATRAALDAGAAPEKVLRQLQARAEADLDALPVSLLASCVDAGLSPDTDMGGGESLLHLLLNAPYPVPLAPDSDDAVAALAAIPAGANPAAGRVTLQELLRRARTPDLHDAGGNTALHMVVACMVQKVHFPDARVGASDDRDGQQQQQQQQADGRDLYDNDAARAAYARVAFRLLMGAGWLPGCRNHNGYTVSHLVEAGLSKYQTELYDLSDPEGVAQTTVGLLEQKAPDKGLREMVDAKIAGVRAVVEVLLEMHSAAADADAPRRARSAGALVGLWLALLVVFVGLLVVWQR